RRSNLGLQDQLEALAFVSREIERFGGDPANVTVFGESAGAGSLCALLAMPSARGLFHRAIVQSAAPEGMLSAEEGATRARLVCDALELDPSDLAGLRALDARKILAVQGQVAEPGPRRIGMFFAPVVDGDLLPERPLSAVSRGASREVALVIGTTVDEMRLFSLVPGYGDMPEAALAGFAASKLGGPKATRKERAERLLAAYPGATPLDRFFAIETDASLFVPATRMAQAHARHQPKTFLYRFAWRSPLAGGRLGACHALDVPFALGTLEDSRLRAFAGEGEAAQRVSRAMMDAWVRFARAGDPGWPAYEESRRATFVIDDPCRVEDAPHEKERALFCALMETDES
ncbi:carboxylesterase family protein, partial [Myxococcota bacterium]|nr:carboxylesterase family protein [Myxococcota bacterium]